jgi:hypothetical protein
MLENTICRHFYVLLFVLLAYNGSPAAMRATIVQQQACTYQAATREVVCQCREEDIMVFLGIRMQGFVKQAGQKVSLDVTMFVTIIFRGEYFSLFPDKTSGKSLLLFKIYLINREK